MPRPKDVNTPQRLRRNVHPEMLFSQIRLARLALVACPDCGVEGPAARLAEHKAVDHAPVR